MKPINQSKNNTYHKALEHAIELSGPEQVFFAEYQAEVIFNLLRKQKCTPESILDYGCGDGTMTFILSQFLPETKLNGVDTSQELIEIAQEWYGVENKKLNFSTKIEKKYDLIYMANVLHHIPKNQHTTLIEQLNNQLTSNGLLIILEFNPFNPFEMYRFYTNKEERGNHMIAPRSVKKIISGYGSTHIYYFKKIYAALLRKP